METVRLGHLHARWECLPAPLGRLLYLCDQGMIVLVAFATPDGYAATVGASIPPRPADQLLFLIAQQVDAARSELTTAELADPDVFVLLWQTRVAQRYPATLVARHAEMLAEQLRPAGTATVADEVIHDRLTIQDARVELSVHHLAEVGLLCRRRDDQGRYVYDFTIPDITNAHDASHDDAR